MAQVMAEREEKIDSTRTVRDYLRQVRWPLVGLGLLLIIFIGRALTGTQPIVDLLSVITLTLGYSTPITIGALSGTFSERSGVVNIAIEGMLLTGAFFGALVAALTGVIWLGLLVAPLAGMALALVHAVLSIYFRVDQIISGTVLNIFAFGLTSYLLSLVFSSAKRNSEFSPLPPLFSFRVSDAPFNIGLISVVAVVLVFIAHYILFFTTWGLRTRACGENPKAADTAGVNVFLIRYVNVMISGFLAGLGGTYFSLQVVGDFKQNMTVGSGFIALAAMIFGRWTPLGAWGAALLFGFCQALDSALQSWYSGIDWLHFITQTLPYIVTIIVLTGFFGRSRPPAAVGQPYSKQ